MLNNSNTSVQVKATPQPSPNGSKLNKVVTAKVEVLPNSNTGRNDVDKIIDEEIKKDNNDDEMYEGGDVDQSMSATIDNNTNQRGQTQMLQQLIDENDNEDDESDSDQEYDPDKDNQNQEQNNSKAFKLLPDWRD